LHDLIGFLDLKTITTRKVYKSKRLAYFMKKILIVAGLFAIVVFAGLVAAQGNSNNSNNSRNGGVSNMTYGQCVVAGVEIKNTCYETALNARESCVAEAGNSTSVVNQCRTDYKQDKKQCKTDFKAAKRECIRITKPGMWERMRYSLA